MLKLKAGGIKPGMSRDSVFKRIISIIRKDVRNNKSEFAEESRPGQSMEAVQQTQQTGAADTGQADQDIYSKQERMEETE
jgi:hypothetical protein